MTNNQDEVVLAYKELMRQMRQSAKLEQMHAPTDGTPIDASPLDPLAESVIEDFRAGKITAEDFERMTEHAEERNASAAREMDDPAIVSSIEAEHEAKARQLPMAAQFLISDAMKSASTGTSKERWVAEVLDGHSGDDAAQLGCLRHIVALWTDGPWAWPRS